MEGLKMDQTMTCIVCEYGWIIIGKEMDDVGDYVRLTDAAVVRSWNNCRGIGGIAKKEYKDEYTLDEIGTVYIAKNKILFRIPCEW